MERPTRGRLEAEVAVGLTEFVGRGRELDVLLSAFTSAAEGRGQIVFLVGDAGTRALAVPSLDDAPRQGLERLADRLRDDPLGAYR